MKKIIPLVIVIITIQFNTFAQTFDWVAQPSNNEFNQGEAISLDAANNSYIAGSTQTLSFLPEDTVLHLDILVAKYNDTGSPLWSKVLGGTGDDEGKAMTTDINANVLVAGYFTDTIQMGNLQFATTGPYDDDIFVNKFNTSGDLQWAVQMETTSTTDVTAISTDAAGNSYVAGSFLDTISIDGNVAGVAAGFDIFIAKLDANGNLLWFNQYGTNQIEGVRAMTMGSNGNLHITGYFSGLTSLGGVTLESAGDLDAFVAQLDDAGTVLWAQQAENFDLSVGTDITTDSLNNVYICGSFIGATSLDGNPLMPRGGTDMFIAKYDANGNFQWAQSAGSTGSDLAQGIAADNQGNVCLTGSFTGFTAFGDRLVISQGSSDAFVAKYDTDGNLLWVKQASSTGFVEGNDIALDAMGKHYLIGNFAGITSFGDDILIPGGLSIFIASGGECGGLPEVSAIANPTTLCEGETLSLSAAVFHPNMEFTWLGPNEFTTTGTFVEFPAPADGSGAYMAAGSVDGCIAAVASTNNVTVLPLASTTISASVIVPALGDTVSYYAGVSEGNTFEWSLNGTPLTETNDTISIIISEAMDVYNVCVTETTDAGCSHTVCYNFDFYPTSIEDTPIQAATLNHISVYPNPARTQLTVSYELALRQDVHLTLSTLSGQTVMAQQYQNTTGLQQHILDVANLPSGLYILQLQTEAGTMTQKVVIQ